MSTHSDASRTSEGKKPAPPRRSGLAHHLRHQQDVAVDSLDRLWGEPGASLMTWLVLGIALALPLCLFLLLQNLQQLDTGLGDAARLSLFMEPGLGEEELEALRAELQASPNVAAVELVTPQEALAEFQALSGFGEALEGLDENPLPAVLVVSPAPLDVGGVEALAAQLGALAGVEHAQLDLQWLQRFQAILELARRFTLWLGGLLCLGVVLVIGNTVRLAIEGRRPEIVVVKLVGGTDAYVARPFLYTGLWYGVGGGLTACLLVQASLWGLQGPAARLAGLYGSAFRLEGLALSGLLLTVLASGLLGWLGAWVAVQRHLRHIEPR